MIGKGHIRVGCLEAIGIPTATAFISGIVFGMLVASMSLWSEDWKEYRWMIALTFSLGGIMVALPFSFSFWGRLLAGPDYSQPKTQAYAYTTRLELFSNDDRTINPIELPVPPWKVRAFAQGIMAGRSLAEASWIGAGGDFTRYEFVALRDALMESRPTFAEWINPMNHAEGWRLTKAGLALMDQYAKTKPSTSPPLPTDMPLKLQELP